MSFHALFQSSDATRNQYLADVLNLFSRDIVRCWADDPQSPYDHLGKPSLRQARAGRGFTLDFALRRRNQVYVALMKFDLDEAITLTDPAQIEAANTSKTFAMFLDTAANPTRYKAILNNEKIDIAGAILIWGAVDPKAARAARKQFSFYDILSLEEICADLVGWNNRDFQMLLDKRVAWSHDLFKRLRQR